MSNLLSISVFLDLKRPIFCSIHSTKTILGQLQVQVSMAVPFSPRPGENYKNSEAECWRIEYEIWQSNWTFSVLYHHHDWSRIVSTNIQKKTKKTLKFWNLRTYIVLSKNLDILELRKPWPRRGGKTTTVTKHHDLYWFWSVLIYSICWSTICWSICVASDILVEFFVILNLRHLEKKSQKDPKGLFQKKRKSPKKTNPGYSNKFDMSINIFTHPLMTPVKVRA